MVQVETLPIALLGILSNERHQEVAGVSEGQTCLLELFLGLFRNEKLDTGSQHNRTGRDQLTCVP